MITIYGNFDSDEYRSFCIPLFDIPRNFDFNSYLYYQIHFISSSGQSWYAEFQDVSEYTNRYSQFTYNGDEGNDIRDNLGGYCFGEAKIYQWDINEEFKYLTNSKFQIIDAVQPTPHNVSKYNNYNGIYKAYNNYNI